MCLTSWRANNLKNSLNSGGSFSIGVVCAPEPFQEFEPLPGRHGLVVSAFGRLRLGEAAERLKGFLHEVNTRRFRLFSQWRLLARSSACQIRSLHSLL
jgi:hypothetical protein